MATSTHPYQRGIYYEVMPIPPVPEHCISVDGGPVEFVIESRLLTDAVLRDQLGVGPKEGATPFDDFGGSVHVCAASDGVEHLRFDCFQHEPHYHYISPSEGGNLICRIDEVAEGDPVEWTVGRLRDRLPEMLDLAGAGELAAAARASDRVVPAVEEVAALLRQAQIDAANWRASV